MNEEQKRIQDLLDSGIETNIDLAFTLMKSTGIRADLPTKKDLAEWIAMESDPSYKKELRKAFGSLGDDAPLPLPIAKKALEELSKHTNYSLLDLEKNMAFPKIVGWMKNLENLYIRSEKKLQTPVPPYVLRLPKLTEWYISGSFVFEGNEAMNCLRRATKITIEFDPDLHTFPFDLEIWSKLESLCLTGTNIKQLNLDQLPALKELKINDSDCGDLLPLTAQQPSALQSLTFQTNEVKTFDSPVWEKLPELQELDICMTKPMPLPDNMRYLKSLTHLFLYDNGLKQLPDSICNLTNLQHLTLNNNKLKALPQNFGNLKQLRTLDLHGNQFVHLPACIGELTALQELDITENPLKTIPENIANLQNIISLKILPEDYEKENIKQILQPLGDKVNPPEEEEDCY